MTPHHAGPIPAPRSTNHAPCGAPRRGESQKIVQMFKGVLNDDMASIDRASLSTWCNLSSSIGTAPRLACPAMAPTRPWQATGTSASETTPPWRYWIVAVCLDLAVYKPTLLLRSSRPHAFYRMPYPSGILPSLSGNRRLVCRSSVRTKAVSGYRWTFFCHSAAWSWIL
ncbi:hypothetical protein M8818_005131 [Zalaria obscura]|uniref:Uncharacterized protein n=1 Tax=Zalaria obscura TaxID=2024903 RepID=A0ACC3S9V0_9PEZI